MDFTVMRLFSKLPPLLQDATIGLGYALIITLIAMLLGSDHEAFRYLSV